MARTRRTLGWTSTTLAALGVCVAAVRGDVDCARGLEEGQSGLALTAVQPGFQQIAEMVVNPLKSLVVGKLEEDSLLARWDGARDTAKGHVDWLLQHARKMTDPEESGFEPLGESHGVQYEYHTGLTAAAGGTRYFRLHGEIDLTPELIVALCLDARFVVEMDRTMVTMDVARKYADERTVAAHWVANPGFPFQYRDGLDLSSYRRDPDGTYWQLALSVPDEVPAAPGVVRSTTRYWAFQLVPIAGGRTRFTLLCQSMMAGWMPNVLVNAFTAPVLSDYTVVLEKTGKRLLKEGTAKALADHVRSKA